MELNDFLIKAKINTYASRGELAESILEDESKELVYKEGEWKYRDRYFGSNKFTGEEIIWQNGRVIWGMNYYGKCLTNIVSSKEVYQFLKKALRQVQKDRPFRGPIELIEDDWKYFDKSIGDIDDFDGYEKIFFQEKLVYELKYHGGIVCK